MNEEINKQARELVEKYDKFNFVTLSLSENREQAKQCALIAVDLLIIETDWNDTPHWQQVKQAIENL